MLLSWSPLMAITSHIIMLHNLIYLSGLCNRCAVGNCFALRKDHETALKNFQRAVQLDSRFAYAHTLCGHEYVFAPKIFTYIEY